MWSDADESAPAAVMYETLGCHPALPSKSEQPSTTSRPHDARTVQCPRSRWGFDGRSIWSLTGALTVLAGAPAGAVCTGAWHDRRAACRRHEKRSLPVLQRELVLGAGGELDGFALDENLDGRCAAGTRLNLHVVHGQRDVNAVAPIVHAEFELLDLRRQSWLEPKHLPTRLHAGQAAQHDVDRASHRPKVDAFGGRPALRVADVALQSPQQELPCLLGLVAGQNPGAHHPAQRRAVRGVRQVIGDGPGELVGRHLVAEIPEQLV